MPTTEFYFVRHAQPNYENPNDASRELTHQGLQDRHLVKRYLLDKGIDVILSSPYKRAVDTLRPLAEALRLPILPVEDFRERRVGSGWIEDFEAFSRRQWADFDHKLPGGESLREVQRRNLHALQEALHTQAGKRVAVGSHGTALSTLLHRFLPSFGYEGFAAIRRLMPWVVHFTFEGENCTAIETVDLFETA